MGRRGAAPHGRAPAHRGPRAEDGPQDELLRSHGRGRRPRRRDGGRQSTYGAPALVIDLGTSTTFELLDETGAFRGGIIAPGMKLGAQGAGPRSRPAGRRGASSPKSLLGRTTVEAMQAGIVMGGGGPHRRPHRYDLGRLRLRPGRSRGPARRSHSRPHDPRRHRRPDPRPPRPSGALYREYATLIKLEDFLGDLVALESDLLAGLRGQIRGQIQKAPTPHPAVQRRVFSTSQARYPSDPARRSLPRA